MPGGYSFPALSEALAERVRTTPAFRRRLHNTMLNLDHPVWVDDPDFDIDHHVHRIAVPPPGGQAELDEIVAHIAGQPMDRSRPLWEMWVVEGLADGTIAVVAKMHHASVDGVSGANLMTLLCSLEADTPAPEPDPDYRPATVPHDLVLAAGGLLRWARRPLDAVSVVQHTVDAVTSWIGRAVRGEAMRPPFMAPRTPFNGTLTGHRSVAFAQLDLAEVKQVKQAFGTTVNDVVLALCAGALREHLADRAALPDQPLLAVVPVSVHGRSEHGGRNQISALFATLPTQLADPVQRLEAIGTTNRIAKDHHHSISASFLQDWARFAAPTTFALAVRAYSMLRLAERHPVVHNLVISNVPGPPMPLYLLGAKILGMYPLGPVFHGAGLNITVLSNDGKVNVGVIACREHVADPSSIVDGVRTGLAELLTAARARTAAEPGTGTSG